MSKEEEKDMLATPKKIKRPKITRNKFANMSKKDWKEANEQSKKIEEFQELRTEIFSGGNLVGLVYRQRKLVRYS
ncbi:hypothetical protein B0I26_12916 [Anoxybacillus vitaminiphilus]|uniref:Uncharacterized protein n=1 Tax=Paranoxybacillus vitaminiphilus TaxID=581036 RepID=A0A327Y3B9_9BACL|nr:hypothetical protein [Anoxybacillus vitaminiphilus]RAK14861.1 hypothetical protein B0I26_12916 [Anoxybacillus vitaminiphilus]